MIPTPFASSVPNQLPAWRPVQSASTSFWESEDVQEHIRSLRKTIDLAKTLQKELETILLISRSRKANVEGVPLSDGKLLPTLDHSVATEVSQSFEDDLVVEISKLIGAKKISLDTQESLSIEAASSLVSTLKHQLIPLNAITTQVIPWEERSVAVRFASKLQKSKRNKLWRKRKRKGVAEQARKWHEEYEKADQEADEWRAREINKDTARHKMESMKEIAKVKAAEERKRLESELELLLIVEKLQELHTIRIQKLKKQGHFLPEEDDKFLERVRAAVEEEERQAAAAAATHAAKDAIASAEESRKIMQNKVIESNSSDPIEGEPSRTKGHTGGSASVSNVQFEKPKDEPQGCGSSYDSVSNLPFEFLHYYHGSTNDMGTLIEVRRTWDAYIRPGGSRIPGHWVQPPPPADEVWASYLVQQK